MRKEVIRETDFSSSELPRTRIAQFFSLLKRRGIDILKVTFLVDLFLMPLLASILLGINLISAAYTNGLTLNELYSSVFYFSLTLLITIPIFYLGINGATFVFKKMIYGEEGLLTPSFFVALKDNWKRVILIGVINALALIIFVVGSFYLILSPIEIFIKVLGITLVSLLFLCSTTRTMYMIVMNFSYESSMTYLFRNGFLFTFLKTPKNLICFFLFPIMFLIPFFFGEVASYVSTLLMLLLNGIFILLWTSNIIAGFDKYINKENYPDHYRLGLYNEEISQKED